MKRPTTEIIGQAVREMQWMCQDLAAHYPHDIINHRRKGINRMMDILIGRARTPIIESRLSHIRSRIVQVQDASSAREILYDLTTLLEEAWKHDAIRDHRQTDLPYEI